MVYCRAFISALVLGLGLSVLVRRVALSLGYVDDPRHAPGRTIHRVPVAYGGGIVFFLTAVIVIALVFAAGAWPVGAIKFKELLGVMVGGLVLIIGGIIDDTAGLKPRYQLIAPIISIMVVLASGIGISTLTNPLGQHLSLEWWNIVLFWLHGVAYKLSLPADLLTIGWMLAMIYTTKLLDGLDGLVSGMTTMGAIVLFFVSLLPVVGQRDTAMLSIVLAGAAAAMTLRQLKGKTLFLGEGGSTLAGYCLGVLAIINGGKIATTLLVMGVPLFDLVWIVARRALWEGRSIAHADRKHLHFRLLDAGLTQRQAVGLYIGLSLVFGLSAIIVQTVQKFRILILFIIIMLLMATIVVRLGSKKAVTTNR